MVHVVTYDLHKPGRDYTPVHEYLKRFDWWHCFESTWLVQTSKSAATIRDDLAGLIDSNDDVFVLTFETKGWASWGLSTNCNDWLKTHL